MLGVTLPAAGVHRVDDRREVLDRDAPDPPAGEDRELGRAEQLPIIRVRGRALGASDLSQERRASLLPGPLAGSLDLVLPSLDQRGARGNGFGSFGGSLCICRSRASNQWSSGTPSRSMSRCRASVAIARASASFSTVVEPSVRR